MGSSVHTETSGTTTEAVSLGAELPAVANLAVQHALVAVKVSRVQGLVAHAALEALLVERELPDLPGFRGIHGLVAPGAFDLRGGLEGHLGGLVS